MYKLETLPFDRMTPHPLSLQGGNESEGRGNPSWLEERGRVCLFAYWLTVDRHGLRPRDDKVGKDGVLIRKKDLGK